jgi:hypothetical protein
MQVICIVICRTGAVRTITTCRHNRYQQHASNTTCQAAVLPSMQSCISWRIIHLLCCHMQEWNIENHNDAKALFGIKDLILAQSNNNNSSFAMS